MSDEKLKPLPHLPLDKQTTHITQEMADRIIDNLVEHYSERIEAIRDVDTGYNNGVVINAYLGAIRSVIDEMGKIMEVPEDDLGYIDLCFELIRRFRAAHDLPMPKVRGKPLAPTPEGPFPEKLAEKSVRESTLKAGFTQAMVDDMVDQYYREYPERCYVQGEAYRREVAANYLGKWSSSYLYFQKLLKERGAEASDIDRMQIANEAADRIRLTCEI